MTPKSLDQIRDELTQEYMQAFDPNDDHSYLAERGFGHGFDACLKALAERVEKDHDLSDIAIKYGVGTSVEFEDYMRMWQAIEGVAAALELERERTRKLVDKLKARCKFVDDESLRKNVRADIKQYEESGE